MYNELLSEANSNRALENNIEKLNDKINITNKQVKQQRKFLMLTKRRLQNLEHVSKNILRSQSKIHKSIQCATLYDFNRQAKSLNLSFIGYGNAGRNSN